MDCFFQRELDPPFWSWVLQFEAATILRKTLGPDTGIAYLRPSSPRVRALLVEARTTYEVAAATGVLPPGGVNDVQILHRLLRPPLCVGALAVGCRPVAFSQQPSERWLLDARPYKSKPRQHYCPEPLKDKDGPKGGVATANDEGVSVSVSPWNVLRYITHLKARRGPMFSAGVGTRVQRQTVRRQTHQRSSVRVAASLRAPHGRSDAAASPSSTASRRRDSRRAATRSAQKARVHRAREFAIEHAAERWRAPGAGP